MPLAALLPLASVHRVREAVPYERITTFATYPELCRVLADKSFDALILDTALLEGKYLELRRCLRAHPIPLVVYIDANPLSISLLLELLPLGVSQVVLRGIDDSKAMLARTVGELPVRNPGVVFLNAFGSELTRLPSRLRAALVVIFSARSMISAKSLAMSAGGTRRSVDRWLRAAGFRPASWFVALARLLRSFVVLTSGGSLTAAAREGGFGSRRTFERQTHNVTGLSIRDVIFHLNSDPNELMRLLVARALRVG